MATYKPPVEQAEVDPQLLKQGIQAAQKDPTTPFAKELRRRLDTGQFDTHLAQFGIERSATGLKKVGEPGQFQTPIDIGKYHAEEAGQPVALSPNRVEPTTAGQIVRAPLNLLGRAGASVRSVVDTLRGKSDVEATSPIYNKITGEQYGIGLKGQNELDTMRAQGQEPTMKDIVRTGAKDLLDTGAVAAEAASYLVGAEGAGSVVSGLAKGAGKQAIKAGAIAGAESGALGGFGTEAQKDDATLGSILASTAIGLGAGAGIGAATAALPVAGKFAMNKTKDALQRATGAFKGIRGEKIVTAATPEARTAMAGELVRQGIKEPQMNVVLNAIDGEREIQKVVQDSTGAFKQITQKVKNNNIDDFKAMYEAARKGNSDAKFTGRATDVVGKNVVSRIEHANTLNKQAGAKLDEVAKNLAGKQVDTTPIQSHIDSVLEKHGIKPYEEVGGIAAEMSDNGSISIKTGLDFKDSDFEGIKPIEDAINSVYERFTNGNMDAQGLHRLKRFIDNQVSYGKEGEGLTGTAETILKGIRRDVDELLDSNFIEYKNVNDQYAQSKQATEMMREILGKQYGNLDQDLKEAKAGDIMRRLLGSGDRTRVAQALQNLEAYAEKTGLVDGKSITDQVIFADILEDIFGTEATTGLQGQVQRAITSAQDVQSGNLLTAAGKFVGERTGKLTRVGQERKDAALRALLGMDAEVAAEKLAPLQKVQRVAGAAAIAVGAKKVLDK